MMRINRAIVRITSITARLALSAMMLTGDRLIAQATPASANRPTLQVPRIIVIPFAKEDEDIRTILEADFNRQIAVATLKKMFDGHRVPTIDFQAALSAMKRDAAAGAEAERDFRDRLFETYKADIYVTVNYRKTVEAGLTSVAIILDSHMTANGLSLSTLTARSRRNEEPDVSAHIEQAIEEMGPEFLETLQARFNEFNEQGLPLALTARIASGSAVTFDSKPANQQKTLADLIEDWADQNALKHSFSIGTSTKNLVQFSDFRAPVREPGGAPLSPRRLGARLAAYLETVGVSATASVTNGAIYVDVR